MPLQDKTSHTWQQGAWHDACHSSECYLSLSVRGAILIGGFGSFECKFVTCEWLIDTFMYYILYQKPYMVMYSSRSNTTVGSTLLSQWQNLCAIRKLMSCVVDDPIISLERSLCCFTRIPGSKKYLGEPFIHSYLFFSLYIVFYQHLVGLYLLIMRMNYITYPYYQITNNLWP